MEFFYAITAGENLVEFVEGFSKLSHFDQEKTFRFLEKFGYTGSQEDVILFWDAFFGFSSSCIDGEFIDMPDRVTRAVLRMLIKYTQLKNS